MNSENNNLNTQQVTNNNQTTQSEIPATNVVQNTSEVAQAVKQNENIINEVNMTPKTKKPVEDMQMPELPKEQVIIETVKKKQRSSAPYIIVLLVVSFLAVWKMDYIIEFFDKSNNNPGIAKNNSDNLVEGLLPIGDKTSNIIVNNIKFYNFDKNIDGASFTFDYASLSKVTSEDLKNVYIEFYDINKNVIYKIKFNIEESLSKGDVKKYSFNVDNYIYENAKYALAKENNEKEINEESILTCKLKETNEGYNLLYKNIYTFKNNQLISYSVLKEIEVIADNTITRKYISDIKTEYQVLNEQGIENNYTETSLSYEIDLNKDLGSFIPLYNKNTTMYVVKIKDLEKKWECE